MEKENPIQEWILNNYNIVMHCNARQIIFMNLVYNLCKYLSIQIK